jgi:5'-3' exoribonuclease 2
MQYAEDRPAPKNEDEMMVIIFEFIDRLFSIVRPRKLLYMAIDGVAPRAKMNQQRSRRFRAAKESCEKTAELKRLKEQIQSNGGQVPQESKESEKFDSNCITPGTPFMHKLAECLRYYIHDRLNNDPGWKNLKVILSDANVPGEGEHKIMDFIRRQRANPEHDPNTHHVLCGADADLIMLGLATHEPNFTIIREEFRPDRPRPCEICSQFGHDTKECTGLAREKSGAHDEMADSFVPAEQKYIFLRLSILREYLNKELFVENLPFKFDIERAIDDWVFMCFFVGNDFLPHLPSLEIREGAIDRLVNLYKSMITKSDGWLTDCGDVNLKRVKEILLGIGEVEDDIFKKRQRNEIEYRQRLKDKKKRSRMGSDLPSQMPAWMKTGPYAPTPLGRPVSTANRFESFLEKEKEADPVDGQDEQRGVKRKSSMEEIQADMQGVELKKKITEEEAGNAEPAKQSVEVVNEEENVDEDANDPVRLWEEGWKQRYYKVKFDVHEDDLDFRYKVAKHYAIGLLWVLKYYYQGVPSWNWYFPYHYAPFASDFVNIDEIDTNLEDDSEPFKPFEQLMAVFPAASRRHIPEPWQSLMTDTNSPIIDFYPEDFQIDLNGKKQSWQGVALLPFVDEKRLKETLVPYYDQLSPEEKKRNRRGNDRIFLRKGHQLYEFLLNLYQDSKKYKNFKHSIELDTQLSGGIAGKVWCDEVAILENEVFVSPLRFLCPDLSNNCTISVYFHDPIYDDEYIFKSHILEGAIIPEATLKPEDFEASHRGGYRPNMGFNRNNDYRNNRNANVANRMIQNTVGAQYQEINSSAYGGQGSLYGAYKSTTTYTQNSNNNYQQYRQQSNYTYQQNYQNRNNNNNNYNNNYNNNRNNNYHNPNNNYNNNRGYQGNNNQGNYNYNNNGGAGAGGNGGNYNNRNNYNNNRNNNNYNNNYNQNRNNQHMRFGDNDDGAQQQQPNQQQRQNYNRQNSR